jgi:predicted DNA-binding transcriptional regulator AlpA
MTGTKPQVAVITSEIPLLLDPACVAKRLSISRAQLWVMRSDGRFPLKPVCFGRAIRFRADEVEQWVKANCPAGPAWAKMQEGAGR